MNILLYIVAALALAGAVFFFGASGTVNTEPTTKDFDNSTQIKEESVETTQAGYNNESEINLRGQGLTKVPEYVFSKKDTTVLDVSNNNLEGSLQAEVRLMESLLVLNLSGNKFTGVPAEVGQLSKLEILDLSGNPITGLPYEIGNLSNLKVLDLTNTNYSVHDLEIIKEKLSSEVEIRI